MSNSRNYKKYLAATLSVAVAGSMVAPAALGAQSTKLTDVEQLKGSSDFYEAVTTLAGKGVIKGFTDGTYRPYQDVTRGQAAAIIARLLEIDKKASPNPGFSDVPKGYRFYNEIAALYDANIIDGVTKDAFQPEKTITRAEMAKMITNAFGLTPNASAAKKFTDVKTNSWYDEFVGALVENEITQGKTATLFDPHSNVTRVQFAAFIYRSDISDIEDPKDPKDPEDPEDPKNPGNTENGELKAPKIIFVGDNVVGNVVDVLDLSEDVPVRFDLKDTGAKAGDTLNYTIGSVKEKVKLEQADIKRGYVEKVISTDALENVLGSLLSLDGVLSSVTGASVPEGYTAATTVTVEDPTVEAALFGLGGKLLEDIGGVLGGKDSILGDVLEEVLTGVTSEEDAVSKILSTEKLPGLNLGENITDNIPLLDGVNLEVVNGIVKSVIPSSENGIFDGLFDNVLGDVLGGVHGTVGTLLEKALDGVTNPDEALGTLIGSTDLIGGVLGGGLTGEVELVDGVLAIVKDGKILDVVTGLVDGNLAGAQEVTVTATISNTDGKESKKASAKYQFQITDLLGLGL